MKEFQKLLLSSKKEEIIEDPFTDTEEVYWLLDDETMLSLTGGGMNLGSSMNLTGWWFRMPQNGCTVVFGVSDREWADCATLGTMTVSAYGLIGVGPTSYTDDGSMNFVGLVDLYSSVHPDGWTPSYNEIYVKINFEDESDMRFYPIFQVMTWMINSNVSGNVLNGYHNGYIKLSNEINRHEPDYEVTIAAAPK